MTIELMLVSAAAVLAGLLVATILPIRLVLTVIAALMPIWAVGPIPPAALDAARYGIAAVLVVRLWASPILSAGSLRSWVGPLMGVGFLITLFPWWRGDSMNEGVIFLSSVLLAWAILSRIDDPWPIFVGFAVGATTSAAVLLASAAGIDVFAALVANQDAGAARLTGLSSSAVRVSVELAIALAVWITVLRFKPKVPVLTIGAFLVCGFALMICGGRTGLVGLLVAGVVAVVRGWVRPLTAIVTTAAAWFVLRQTEGPQSFNTIDRLLGEPEISGRADFSSGRVDLLREAWGLWLERPIMGPGTSSAHLAPLYFASLGGVAAGVFVAWLTFRLALMSISNLGRKISPEACAGSLISAIFFVSALLEPYGPFLGFEFTVLLLACALGVARNGLPTATTGNAEQERTLLQPHAARH
ncbi:hypothetical protein [Dietzia maris]|uniref:hypothetical protein n=1 Tax=Dietzia maris TaxID=37915 RepID=UPI0037C8026E